ncbi:MAG: LysM peptidoglycan-binding domain-containing protein [Mariprofundaceae bacterium]|nr:LysM peptidoglycan-binding domain-containing protein [Mariprofundaceae bacterium]
MQWINLFHRYSLAAALILSSLISVSCVQKKGDQAVAGTPSVATEAIIPDTIIPDSEPEQHYPGSSELFKGLPFSDLAASQAEVKRHVLPHWPKIAERSRYVRGRLLAVLEAMDAPSGLQAIPVIESGYNPYALSHAGAMGLWQLMPRTAKGLGVSSSGGLNGRRNVEISTQAAADYLISMRERFGHWPLAFAAYHLGPTAVARRLKHSPWRPEDGLNSMPVPSVTRAYVRHVIGFAALLHMKSIEFPEPFPTTVLELLPPVDLKMLASVSGLDRETLFLFNPGLDHSQYLKDEVALHIPREHEAIVVQKLEEVGPEYVNATIQSGDSLWTLARRHHTSVTHLRRLNPELGNLLSIGKQLKVPANQLARANPLPNPLLSQGRRIRYKVRSGDSLWVIAQRFGTTARDIARSNQISQDKLIRPGDTLWILARIRPS